MSVSVITPAQQGYQKNEGNLLDAATSALALYNLPQSMKLQMQRQRLQNQGLGLSNQGQGISNQQQQQSLKKTKSEMTAPGGLGGEIDRLLQPVNSQVLPSTLNPPPDDSPANGRSGPPAYGPKTASSPGSIDDASGNMYANTNENSSSGGITNDMTVKGTSAEEMGLDPYNTGSMLSAAHANILARGLPDQNAPQMANGMSAHPNSQLPFASLDSTQGGGPNGSPFNSRPFSSKGLSFNSGETGDNAGSLPREDSQQIASVNTPQDHAKLAPGAVYRDPSGVMRKKSVPAYA